MFRIVLLFVSEEVSVARQLKRGKELWDHNRRVLQSGEGTLLEERTTDIDVDLCRKRYKTFKETTYHALESLRQLFQFHFIDAEGDLHTVQERILSELTYQSSLELSPEVYEVIRAIPVAAKLALHARQELVERLEGYAETNKPLFERVVRLVEAKMIPIIRTHAISGHARINSEDELLDDMDALRMMIDVFSERGYHATVDIHRMEVPLRVDPQTYEIICHTKKVYRIEVCFQPSDIRRGH
jgi:adenylate kinase